MAVCYAQQPPKMPDIAETFMSDVSFRIDSQCLAWVPVFLIDVYTRLHALNIVATMKFNDLPRRSYPTSLLCSLVDLDNRSNFN